MVDICSSDVREFVTTLQNDAVKASPIGYCPGRGTARDFHGCDGIARKTILML